METTILDLPVELVLDISSYLGCSDAARLAQTCRSLHSISNLIWKDLYRRDISDLPVGDSAMQDYRKVMQDTRHGSPNDNLHYAAEHGYEKLAWSMIRKGASNYNMAMYTAAKYGHMSIVELMLQRGATGYHVALKYAAGSGRMDIVKLMLQKNAGDYNEAMVIAASGGHIGVVELLLQKGADDYNDAMHYATVYGRMGVVEFIERWRACNS